MKLKNNEYANASHEEASKKLTMDSITDMLSKFEEKNRNVYITKLEDQIFFYKALGRSDYKQILENDNFDDMQKEEIICQYCLLWPEDYDFENCEAGIPTELAKVILRNSYLDSVESRTNVLGMYRQEMFDLDNQITCIINEAFPQFDIEDIESWGVEKTTKYLSRAEWKLHNLRGLEFYDTDSQESYYEKQQPKPEAKTQEKTINNRGGSKEKLTPEKLRELEAKFPEIDWRNDSVATEGIRALEVDVSTESPALRPGR